MHKNSNKISDQQSESQVLRRGRRPQSPDDMLSAANRLFASSNNPLNVTMDAIAAEAGVGKGTLFRAFGSRDNLLDTLWAANIRALKVKVDSNLPPFNIDAPPQQRLTAFLDAVLNFKLENRHLIRARELSSGLLRTPHYLWMHQRVQAMLNESQIISGEMQSSYDAHTLLSALHIDLIEELLNSGFSLEMVRKAQANRVQVLFNTCS